MCPFFTIKVKEFKVQMTLLGWGLECKITLMIWLWWKAHLNEAILKQVLITKKTPKTYFFHLFLLKGKGPSSKIEKGPKTSTSRRIIWGRVWWWWRWWWCGGKLWWLRTVQHVFIKKKYYLCTFAKLGLLYRWNR